MQINFSYDSSVSAAPAGFTTALAAAASYLDGLFINPITVTIQVGWQEVGGRPLGAGAIGEGGPDGGTSMAYSTLRADLTQNPTSSADVTALASLPASDPTNGG